MNDAPNSGPIRVLLMAPPMSSWGLERIFQTESARFQLVGVVADWLASAAQVQALAFDVIVVDHDDAQSWDVLDDMAVTLGMPMVVITAVRDAGVLDKAVLAGVRGIVRKSDSPQVLLRAVQKVHEGELWVDRSATSRLFMEIVRQKASHDTDPEAAKIATLTQRERQMIAALIADTSAPGKVIASRLCISEHTLRNHLSSIYSKLDVCNRLDLYAYARRHKLDGPPVVDGPLTRSSSG